MMRGWEAQREGESGSEGERRGAAKRLNWGQRGNGSRVDKSGCRGEIAQAARSWRQRLRKEARGRWWVYWGQEDPNESTPGGSGVNWSFNVSWFQETRRATRLSIHPATFSRCASKCWKAGVATHNEVLSFKTNSQETWATQKDAVGTNRSTNFIFPSSRDFGSSTAGKPISSNQILKRSLIQWVFFILRWSGGSGTCWGAFFDTLLDVPYYCDFFLVPPFVFPQSKDSLKSQYLPLKQPFFFQFTFWSVLSFKIWMC